MKKIILLLLVLCLVIPSAVMADTPSVTTIDVSRDIICVSGAAQIGDMVTIIVLNPGYTYEDYTGDDREKRNAALQYLGFAEAGDNGYSLSFRVTGDAGGEFTLYAAGEEETFEYFSKTYKENFLADFNSGTENDLAKLIKVLGLSAHPLYTEGESADIVSAVEGVLPLSIDAAEAYNTVFDALLLSAINNNKESVLVKDGQLQYIAALGLDTSDEYKDYTDSISQKGRDKINDALLGGNYGSKEDVKKKFCELLYVNLIMNNKEGGYGHVQSAFEKYSAEYHAAGIRFPASVDKTLYQRLLGSGADTLVGMKAVLADTGSKDETSLGVGKNISSAASSGSYVKPEETQEATEPNGNNQKPEFTDINADHWAYSAVTALAEKDVINGYDTGEFRPEICVTRAEFTKMAVVLLKLTDGSAEFEDVKPSNWFAPYVGAAASRKIILGTDGKFNPSSNITRQDAAVILARILKLDDSEEVSFSDSKEIADYARASIASLYKKGVISGFEDGTFAPLAPLTRAQAAMMLYKLAQEGVTIQ